MIENFRKIVKGLYADNLYKNSFYLMLSNIVNGLFGFIFLIIATRLYSSQDIGMYSALFSMMSLIILVSMSGGFSTMIIRLLPNASQSDKNRLIFFSIIINCFIVILISLMSVLFIDTLSPKLIFLKDLFYGFIFILFTVFLAVSTLFTSVFMALRKTQYILIKGIITNIGKIFLLPLFISLFYIGIFYSTGIATFLDVVICLFLLYKAKLIKDFKLNMNFDIIKKNFDYIFTNQLSIIITGLPSLLFSILIINILSAEMNAYFFVVWAIFSMIIMLIMSILSSFFVECSYEESEIKKNRNKGLKASLIIATIWILGIILFGKFVLSLCGEEYLNALNLLYVFTISIYPYTINKTYLYGLLIKKKMKEALMFNFLISITIIISGTLLMFYFGLIGVGYGWLIGQAISIVWILARLKLSHQIRSEF